ncbi:restriction endonuclease subunit S [Nocardia arizonensis]|uniref:restriction endonuclease subunit S n=1 Tax=Nocardia arizonensis TaxID=1141647 RepID=UPI0006CF3198|nr:restriction endonuclease subunit S [Nocardia arizonensis]
MSGWPRVAVLDAVLDVTPGGRGIPRSRYLDSGAVPVVDQGRARIAGYTDDLDRAYTGPLPVLVFGDHTRLVDYVDFRFAPGAEGVRVLCARPGFDTRYLCHALGALPLPEAGYARYYKFLKEAELPAPPLPTQRRIAELLDSVETLRAERTTSLELAEELVRSVFYETFGPELEWPLVSLESVARFHSGTTLPVGAAFTGQPSGHLLLKVADLTAEGNDLEIATARSWSATPGTRAASCPAGCVVFPKRGGAIATNKKRLTVRPAVLDPNLMAIRPHGVELRYLFEWLRGLDLLTLATGSSVPQINKKDLAPLLVPIPPRELQRAFARRAEILYARCRTLRAQLSEFDALAATLRHRFFGAERSSPSRPEPADRYSSG